jgi:DNA-binding MarR family transcriptional regulator
VKISTFGDRSGVMLENIDLNETAGCTCRRARRTTRQLIRIFDTALEPAGLSANQFEVLVYLYGCGVQRGSHVSVGALADLIGKDATTLTRDLKPLKKHGLVADIAVRDRRVRGLAITRKGRIKLSKAIPFWRSAQSLIQKALGLKTTQALNELLDLAFGTLGKIAKSGLSRQEPAAPARARRLSGYRSLAT